MESLTREIPRPAEGFTVRAIITDIKNLCRYEKKFGGIFSFCAVSGGPVTLYFINNPKGLTLPRGSEVVAIEE